MTKKTKAQTMPLEYSEDCVREAKYIQIKLKLLKGRPRNMRGVVIYTKSMDLPQIEWAIKSKLRGLKF